MLRPFILISLLLTVLGCASFPYDKAPKGVLTGGVLVYWVGGNDTGFGDGRFIYIPSPGRELTFTYTSTFDQTERVLRPEPIYTDGGSIPRPLQVFKGFAPWAYAPAYVIHDWAFVAKRCMTDNQVTEARKPVGDMTFEQSAELLAAVLQTMVDQKIVKEDALTERLLTQGVSTGFSRPLWEAEDQCEGDKLSKDDQQIVNDLTRLRSFRGIGQTLRVRGNNVRFLGEFVY